MSDWSHLREGKLPGDETYGMTADERLIYILLPTKDKQEEFKKLVFDNKKKENK